MASYNENECAYCAEEINPDARLIGKDWKVYCSPSCAAAGEQLSTRELLQTMARGSSSMSASEMAGVAQLAAS